MQYIKNIDSTSTELRRRMSAEELPHGYCISADFQTAGHGQATNHWESEDGKNLLFSLLLRPSVIPASEQFVITEIVTLAIINALQDYIRQRITIKWPNDILVDGNKISGCLIEYSGRYVIVGIGINVMSNPTVDKYKTTKMDNYSDVPLEILLKRLMRNLDKWMSADFRYVRERWLDLAACLNCPVKYQGQMATLVGINENGALVLRRDSRYILVYGDEISV